jgi:hypothetical protein
MSKSRKSAARKSAKVVSARKATVAKRRQAIKAATSRIKTKASIDFSKSVGH